jgi:putative transposase
MFKELLHEFRIRKSLHKMDLAKHLNKSETYIRKIEVLGYTPPTFEVCTQLAELLELSADDKRRFMEAAFKERIQSESQFFDYLYSTQSPSHSPGIPYQETIDADGNIYSCHYHITLMTKFNTACLKGKIAERLYQFSSDLITDFSGEVLSLNIQPAEMHIQLKFPPSVTIQDFVKGFKSLTSSNIRNQFPQLQDLPSLWENTSHIKTLGHQPVPH